MSKPRRLPVRYVEPGERVAIEIIHQQAAAFRRPPFSRALLNSASHYLLIFNQQRQIVFASRNFGDLAADKRRDQLLGARLGDALDCVHSKEEEGGCGMAKSCRKCGAARAILSSLAGHSDAREYRVTRLIDCGKQPMHMLVMSRPLVHRGELFSVVALTDGSDAKSRLDLQRLFREGIEPKSLDLVRKPKLAAKRMPISARKSAGESRSQRRKSSPG